MNKTITNSYIFSVGSTFTNNNYIDVTSLYLNDNNYYEIGIYDEEITYTYMHNDKYFVVNNIPNEYLCKNINIYNKENNVVKQSNAYFFSNYMALFNYKLTNLPVGNYRLSFSRLSGFNDKYTTPNVEYYKDIQLTYYSFYRYDNDLTFDDYIFNSSVDNALFKNENSGSYLYNVYSTIKLTENDLQNHYFYYANIKDIDSVSSFATKYQSNYCSSIDFGIRNETDKVVCLFYVPRIFSNENISLTEQYSSFVTDFKLEYKMNPTKQMV
jgi:hypothetical protein